MKKFTLLLLVLCAAFLPVGVFAVPGWAATYYVDAKAGDDSKDGTSETAPLKTIQAALRKASDQNGRITANTTISLLSDIDITETVNPVLCLTATTLTINGNGHTLSLQKGQTGSVISVSGEAGKLNINDLTITGGNAPDSGGGISIAGGNFDLTVTNCVFKDNHASGTEGSSSGGAIYYSSSNTLNVTRCTFTGNTTTQDGGAICVSGAESASITNCTFYNNTSRAGKGDGLYAMLVNQDPNATVNYCTFVSNRTDNKGTEIYIDIDENAEGATATVTNSIVYGEVSGFTLDDNTNLRLASIPTAASKDVTAEDGAMPVTHTFFRVNEAVGRGDDAPDIDQLGAIRAKAAPTIGAVAFDGKMTFTVTATKGLTAGTTDGTFSGYVGQAVTLSPDVTPAGLASGAEWSIKEVNTALPPGLTLDTNTGVISGTPKEDIKTAKDYTFTLIAQNIDYSAEKKLTVTINPITIEAEGTTAFTATKGTSLGDGKTVEFKVTPTGRDYTWNVSPTSDNGVTATIENGKLTLKGTPTTAKDYTFKVKAQKTVGSVALSSNEVTVKLTVSTNVATITSDPATISISGKAGVALEHYTATFSVTAPKGSYEWSVTPSEKNGIKATIDKTSGELEVSGTPTEAGNYDFKVTAKTADNSVSGEKEFTVTVGDPILKALSVDITGEKDLVFTQGVGGSRELTAKVMGIYTAGDPQDVTSDCTLTWSTKNTCGVTINNNKLTVPASLTASKYTVPVTVEAQHDGVSSATATADFAITITSTPPEFDSAVLEPKEDTMEVQQGETNSKSFTATALDKDKKAITDVTWSWAVSEKDNKSISTWVKADKGTVTAKPGTDVTAGIYTVTVTATPTYQSQARTAATATLTITVTTPDTPAKTDPTVTAPTVKSGLVYTGAAQDLLETKGSTTGGTLKYSLDKTNYDTAIPTGTNAGEYTVWYKVEGNANYNSTTPVWIKTTISPQAATVTAKAQTVKEGESIATGTDKVTADGLLSGHTLSAVTLTASSTASATTSGTITPSGAKITDGKNDVTANYAITYEKGTLTVESGSSGGGESGGGSGGGETTPIDPSDPDITGVKLNITTDTPVVTLTPGETKKLNFTATAEITYKNGDKKTETARIKTWWRGDGAWPDWMKIQSSFSANPNTVDLTPGADVGGTTMTCRVAAETESYNGHTDWAECEFKVTVEAPETFTPKNLFFEKPRIEMTVEPGNTVEDSCKVRLQLYGSRGTVKESTDGYTLVCRKANDSGASWVTSSVDGWTITFKSAPPADWHWSDSTIFVINAMDKDGKQYLSTSYLVVSYVSNVKSYQLTAAPTEVTVLTGKKDSVDLKKSVRFEKVYENGKRVLLDGAKLTFSPRTSDRVAPWMDLDSDGVVTLAPGADVEPGRYFCDYRAVANDNGRTGTSEGTLIVNVVNTGAPKITTETLPDVEVGTTYSAQMTAEGLSPISWDIVSGTLPEGLTFDRETGKLSGTPTLVSDYTFDVQARNSAGDDHRVFNLKVRDQKPSGWCWTKSKKATKSGSTGKWHAIFHVKNGTNVNYYNKSTTRDNLDKDHLKKVTKTKGARAGEGNIKYDLLWPKTNNKWEEYTYKFKVQAGNDAGTSTYEKSFTAAKTTGKLSVAGVSLAADDIILTDEDDGVETFEPYEDGKATEADGQDEGVTYYANGGVDEEGHLSVVIGKAAEGVEEGKEYVFESIAKIPADSLDKVVSVEFRGATVDGLGSLPNLEDLAIDNGSLGNLDLNGRTKLKSVSLYSCKELKRLVVNGCSSLESLSVMKCPKLSNLDVTGCGALENVDVMGAAITELDLSKRSGLATLNLNDCGKLATLNVAGCSALTDVSLNGTAIPYLDLSECSALTSLSLADAAALTELTLPSGASFDNFTLTGSRVGALTLKGTEKLTMLDLSGNAGLTTLALSGCSALSELDVSGCGFEILDLSGCTSLEKLNASECAAMTTLTLPGSGAQDVSVSDSAPAGKLKELSVGGCAELRSLNVSGQSLGHLELEGLKWLTSVQCAGQFIGNIDLSQPLNLKDYAGNCLYRVSDVQGYAADGSPVETSWNKDTGVVTFASAPYDMSYAYDTGLYGYVLGVTVSTSSDPADGPDSPTSNRGGGGCDSGLGVLALSAVGLLSVKRRK